MPGAASVLVRGNVWHGSLAGSAFSANISSCHSRVPKGTGIHSAFATRHARWIPPNALMQSKGRGNDKRDVLGDFELIEYVATATNR